MFTPQKVPSLGCVLILCLALGATSAHADTNYWTTGSSNFWTAGPWSLGHPPTSEDIAFFDQSAAYTVLFDAATGDGTADLVHVSAGDVTLRTLSGPIRTLNANEGVRVYGAFPNSAERLTLDALNLNAGANGVVTIGAVGANSGSHVLNVVNSSTLSASLAIHIHSGELLVDGSGSSATATGSFSAWGQTGGVAFVTLQNGATGTFGNVNMAVDSIAGTSATVQVQTGAHLNTASLLLLPDGGLTKAATLGVQGSGSTVTQSGASTLTMGHSSEGSAAINIGTTASGAVFTTGTGTVTIKKTGAVTIGSGANTGTLNANGNVTIDGGVLQRSNAASSFNLATGKTMTIQNGGRASFTGGYTSANAIYNITGGSSKMETLFGSLTITNGGQVNVSNGGLLSADTNMHIGVNAGTAGTLTVDGSGSSATAVASVTFWGYSGGTASITFSNGAMGNFAEVGMAVHSTSGTAATLNVQSGASLSLSNLTLATEDSTGVSATININGTGSLVSQTGASALTVGNGSTSPAAINIGTTASGGMLTTGTGLMTINKTGTITVGGGLNSGTLNVDGDLLIDGGILSSSLFGGTFSLAADKTMAVRNGGRATFGGGYNTESGAVYHIASANSKLETLLFNLTIASGAVVNVETGGQISSGSGINIASGLGVSGNGTLTVDGGVSSAVASAGSTWGGGGATANVSFSNGASGTFSDLVLASDSTAGTTALVNVSSGADLTTGSLTLAAASGASTSATLNVQGAGSTVVQNGASTLIVGDSGVGTAAINIGTSGGGATFTTGTGLTTIKKTGTVIVGGGPSSSTFNVNGDLTIDDGVLATGFFGAISLAAGRTMTATNGGRATFIGGYSTASGAIYNIAGAGSKIETMLFDFNIASGAVVIVGSGGLVASADKINVGVGSAGALAIDVGGSATSVGTFTVGSMGTVTGHGTIQGNVSNGGLVAPGQSAGVLHVSGNYTQTAGGTLRLEIGGTEPGLGYDQLLATGTADLGGTLDVDLINAFIPQAGDSFNILDWSSSFSSFTTLDLPALSGSLAWDTSQLYSSGILRVFLAGDYNLDGAVDAADYVVWRKGVGVATTPGNYNLWRTNFGQPASGGSEIARYSNATVPEPTSVLLLIFGVVAGANYASSLRLISSINSLARDTL